MIQNNDEEIAANNENASVVYEELGRNYRYLTEWRHRSLVRFFIIVTAFSVAAKWLFESQDSIFKQAAPFVFFLISFSCVIFYIMDLRSRKFANMCARIGGEIEMQSLQQEGFFYAYFKMIRQKGDKANRGLISYSSALTMLYLGSAFIFSVVGLLCLVFK